MAKGKRSTIGRPEPWSEEHWKIERDLEAIIRAKAVEKDPERMKKVRAMAKQKVDEYKRQEEEAKAAIDLGEGKDI
jgi:hypothetical protein